MKVFVKRGEEILFVKPIHTGSGGLFSFGEEIKVQYFKMKKNEPDCIRLSDFKGILITVEIGSEPVTVEFK